MPEINNNEVQTISLTIRPYPPDTVDTVRSELKPMIETALREQGKEDLLASGQVQVDIEKTLPLDSVVIDAIITIIAGTTTGITVEVFKTIVIPKLKKRFGVEEKEEKENKKSD